MDHKGRRTRVRFEDVEYEEFPDSRCRVAVRMEWAGRRLVGEATGNLTREGILQTAARAALQTLEEATEERLALSLLGIKAVRAFDGWVIVAAVSGRAGDASYKLLGAQASPGEATVRAAVLTILDATNRIVAKYLLSA